jgi:hypothetical protein
MSNELALFALSVESVFALAGKAWALAYGRSDVLRIVGREFAPAGDLLSCFAKKDDMDASRPPPPTK